MDKDFTIIGFHNSNAAAKHIASSIHPPSCHVVDVTTTDSIEPIIYKFNLVETQPTVHVHKSKYHK